LPRPDGHHAGVDFDIGPLLDGWQYQPGQVGVRRFIGLDGKEKIQLRVDIGILQMNAEGRPDGKRPMGYKSYFHYCQARLYKHTAAHNGSEEGFKLEPEDCSKLHLETVQYHQRAFCLLQLEDYAGVVRDAERNGQVFEFVRKHGPAELATALSQIFPQQVMVLTRARASIALKAEDYPLALRVVTEGIAEIETFAREHGKSEEFESSGELLWLRAWFEDIQAKKPLTKREKLERALQDAVTAEDYEKAAEVRDQLKKLKE